MNSDSLIKLQNRRNILLRRIQNCGPILEGSLFVGSKLCGKSNCRCRTRKEMHRTATLTWKDHNKTKSLYLPLKTLKEVRKWLRDGKKMKGYVRRLSDTQRQILHETLMRPMHRSEQLHGNLSGSSKRRNK